MNEYSDEIQALVTAARCALADLLAESEYLTIDGKRTIADLHSALQGVNSDVSDYTSEVAVATADLVGAAAEQDG